MYCTVDIMWQMCLRFRAFLQHIEDDRNKITRKWLQLTDILCYLYKVRWCQDMSGIKSHLSHYRFVAEICCTYMYIRYLLLNLIKFPASLNSVHILTLLVYLFVYRYRCRILIVYFSLWLMLFINLTLIWTGLSELFRSFESDYKSNPWL